ncbi:MAG: type I methionyl aminopeptidase [Bacteroidaceae bacterium]|nr:type I methionyl aminopeptidase [Prevotellaceae bacterium]MDY5631751.1 type I methionyl aminopeptidase [Bacteroidaceae bacterium]
MARKRNVWEIPVGHELTEMDRRILEFQERGKLVPTRDLIKTPEQIAGIRKAGVLNTDVLDKVQEMIRPGISTLDIDKLVYEYTTQHGGIPAPLNYEGFPNSCCTSINDVVCHGIPRADDILEEGDIINVDCTTIVDGYFADASRMFVVGGKTQPRWQKLVDVAWECLKIGEEVCAKPYVFVGDLGNAIAKHAHKNHMSVVRDLCGHGVGLEFHEQPDVEHFGHKGTGMLLVPGMTFTIEPMINLGHWQVCVDDDDPTGWVIVTEDYEPSAQWEHTYVMTENGVEVLTH